MKTLVAHVAFVTAIMICGYASVFALVGGAQ